MTATEFADALGVPYPTVAGWLRKKQVPGAEYIKFGKLTVWQIPEELVKSIETWRPKQGRPRKDAKPAKKSKK